MAIQRSLLAAMDNDFNSAVRVGDKDKAIATFSALIGMAIAVAPTQAQPLYTMLTKVTAISLNQLVIDKNSIISLVAKNCT